MGNFDCLRSRPSVAKTPVIAEAINYGNGVYFFPYLGAEFGNTLSGFIAEHINLELVSFSQEQFGFGGVGYFIIFKEK